MKILKRWFKRNSHNPVQKILAGFGRSMNRWYENRNHDIHSNGEVWLLKKIANLNPKVIIDGGANVGEYALEATKICTSASVHCFEPVPDTSDLLKKAIGNYSSNVIVITKGLSDVNQQIPMNLFEYSVHSSLYSHNGITSETKTIIDIEVIKGDDYVHSIGIEKIDLLKLDIEGAEMKALKGFENCLREKRIRVVQFEYGYLNILTKNLLMDYYDFFEPLGYRVGKLYPKKIEFKPYSNKLEDFIGPNYVAVLETEIEFIRSVS